MLLQEQLQENLVCYLDWLPQEILETMCQIIIDTVKEYHNE
jgi:hypothetical protein